MQHPDTDLLNTWLDGELSASDGAHLEAHLAACPACAARAREQRALHQEADRLLAELDEPIPTSPPAIIERDVRSSTIAHPAGRGSPVVLLPYTELIRQRRGVRRRVVGVAATLFVAAGAGWMALRSDASEGRAATDILSNARSPAASTLPPSSAPAPTLEDSAPGDLGVQPAEGQVVAPPVNAPDSERGTTTGPPSAAPPEPAFAEARVSPVSPRRDERAAPAAAAFKAGIAPAEPQRVAELKALNDREPLTVERDAQISTRIGLDEARRELGGNLHVIDGMQAELVGLVPGRLVPGADPSRPVVRVVYLDGQGQSFFLDQQRIAADSRDRQALAEAVPGAWLDGDVQLRLHGALSNDSLAGLARRVK
jgi:anti-sigma factor RsiW